MVREIALLIEHTRGPFPHGDLHKMRKSERLVTHFESLGDDDFLAPDFNTYCMCIQGIASRFQHGSEDGTPERAIQWLALGDFFDLFPKYRFLEGEWEVFSHFAREYIATKRLQEIELSLLLTPEKLLALKEHNPCQGWGHFLGPIEAIVLDDDDEDVVDVY